MPQLGEQKEKKEKKAKRPSRGEVVSAYSEEGKRRNKNKKRMDILFIVLSVFVLIAMGLLFFYLASWMGGNPGAEALSSSSSL